MGKAHLNTLTSYLVFFMLLLSYANGMSQDTGIPKVAIIDYIPELEKKFNIKFSLVDEDLEGIEIPIPEGNNLESILSSITDYTQLRIQKLSNRYYTITKSITVDICGRVLDNFEENTIPGATVEVLGSSLAGVTDSNGNFFFENVPTNAILQIKYLGYKTMFVTAQELIQQESCTTLALAQNYQELDEVIVYKFLTSGLYKLNDASVQISTSEFGILPGLSEPDILQTIQALPGIKSVDETVSDINIRGGSNDQNLMLWDGIKMYQSGHFFGLISAFNPYLTDKVTVIKNGASAEFGDGVSGILDMRTRNTIENEFFGGAGLNFISGDVYGQLPITKTLAVQFSGRRSHTDFLNTPTYNTFSEKAFQDSQVQADSDFYFYDFTGKVMYDVNQSQRLRFSLISMNNNLDYLETSDDGSRNNQSRLDQTNLSFGGNWESNWNNTFTTNLNAYFTRYGLNALTISNNGAQSLLQNNRVLETSVKLHTKYKVSQGFNWINGYQFTETGIENKTDLDQPFFESTIIGVVRTHSLYSEINYSSRNKKVIGSLGGRLNYNENLDTFQEFRFEPRLNISYELAPHLKTEFLGEFKSQTTNQIIDLEQNFLGIEKRRWILSDGTTLPITKSRQGSLGLNYDENSFYIGLEGFYKEVNGINVQTQGFQNQNQFNGEIGKYAVKGLEFLINQKNNYYSVWLSYAYNHNDYTFETINPPRFPNNLDVRHAITLAGNYVYNNFKIGIGFNYRSGKPFTRPDRDNPINDTVFPNEINYEAPNSSRLTEYFRADASATYDFNLSSGIKASLGASVLNFTDRKNTLNTFYRLNDMDEVETIQRISLGVTPNVSLRIHF